MKQAKNDNNSTYSMTHKNAIYVELHIYQFYIFFTQILFPSFIFYLLFDSINAIIYIE